MSGEDEHVRVQSSAQGFREGRKVVAAGFRAVRVVLPAGFVANMDDPRISSSPSAEYHHLVRVRRAAILHHDIVRRSCCGAHGQHAACGRKTARYVGEVGLRQRASSLDSKPT